MSRKDFAEGYRHGVEYGLSVRRGFMDKTDFDHELGVAKGGSRVFASLKDLRKSRKCTGACGVVEVEVRLVRVVDYDKF